MRADGRGYVSGWRTDETDAIGEVATKFVASELVANRAEIEQNRVVGRDVWRKAGDLGLLCCSIPQEYGGGGGTLAHDIAVAEAQPRAADTSWGNMLHSGIVAPYINSYGTEEQKLRWLPGMASGETVAAIAMTEPSGGSDLKNIRTRAVRDGEHYVLNGSKTFVSNGSQADLVIVVAKTDPAAGHKGISLIGVETSDCPGFSRGRKLEKIGQHGADTSELFFEDARVPVGHLLGGQEGRGFVQLMQQLPQERLLIGVVATAAMETAVDVTIAYTKSRSAFDQRLFDFQNTRFVLAEAATKAHVARVFLDSCVERHLRGELDAATASMCKWWLTELQCEVIDQCLQLFGGYGYMSEYPIARMYADARVQKIYGGANEILKELISRSL